MAREPADIVARRVALGEQLAAFRGAAEMRQGQLARLVFRDRTTVVHIEKGRAKADEQFWHAADVAVGAGGVLIANYQELEAAKHDHEQRGRQAELARARARVAASLSTDLGHSEAACRERLDYLAVHPRQLDAGALDALGVMLHASRQLEDVIGARPLLPSVRSQLTLLESLVTEARGAIRPKAVSLGSQYAQFAAWLHASSGKAKPARALYDLATEWALEVDDPHMVATALSMKGHVAYKLGKLGPMLGLSQAAQHDKRTSPGVRALASQQEGRGHALLEDASETDRKLDEAISLTLQAAEHPEDEPPWVYFFSTDYLVLQRGRAYRYLGRYAEAAELLEAGLAALPDAVKEAEWAVPYRHDLTVVRTKL